MNTIKDYLKSDKTTINVYKKIYEFDKNDAVALKKINTNDKSFLGTSDILVSKDIFDIYNFKINNQLRDKFVDYVSLYMKGNVLKKKYFSISDLNFKLWKKLYNYKYKVLPQNINDVLITAIDEERYYSLYHLNIDKKNMNTSDSLIFVPIILSVDQTEIGAVIVQEDLASYVITSDTFKDDQKKISLTSLLTKPLTATKIITITDLASI